MTSPEKETETEIMASSKNRTRILTQDEDEEAHRKEEIELDKEPELDKESDHGRADVNKGYQLRRRERIKKREMERKHKDEDEDDDSEQTLGFLSRWEAPEIPPEKIVIRSLVEQCSRPIRKQLTRSDVEQSRLALSKPQVKKKFRQLLQETEISRGKEGITVSVYGPDGKVLGMKMCSDENNLPELTMGWRKFVRDYQLREYCDFVTIWMFRNRDTQQICFAIDVKRFAFRKQVSTRISNATFNDSD